MLRALLLLPLAIGSVSAFLSPSGPHCGHHGLSEPRECAAASPVRSFARELRPALRMSLFASGSGVSGAVTKERGELKIELPTALDNSEPFVFDTMTDRVPTKIIGRTVDFNQGKLPQKALDKIADLGREIKASESVSALSKGPNAQSFNEGALKPFIDAGAGWKQVPWYTAETYVYHRLLEATDYWETGAEGFGFDIFAAEKEAALSGAKDLIAVRMEACLQASGKWDLTSFTSLVHMALWGNQGDSSLFTVDDLQGKGNAKDDSKILADETEIIFDFLSDKKGEIHMFNDNSGMELVSDLALVHYLISTERFSKVVLNLKPYPFFVSDAMPSDVMNTLSFLRASGDPNQVKVAEDLEKHMQDGKLELTHEGPLNLFLANADPMWEMPEKVRAQLATSADLVITKGDLMYRKLLGDRTFGADERFDEIISYFPTPVAALRTNKSPLAIGLPAGRANELFKSHPQWQVDGEFGVIQISIPKPSTQVSATSDVLVVRYDADKVDEQWDGLTS